MDMEVAVCPPLPIPSPPPHAFCVLFWGGGCVLCAVG